MSGLESIPPNLLMLRSNTTHARFAKLEGRQTRFEEPLNHEASRMSNRRTPQRSALIQELFLSKSKAAASPFLHLVLILQP